MSLGFDQLATRIRDELSEIDHTLARAMEGLQRAKQTGDDHYLDGVALSGKLQAASVLVLAGCHIRSSHAGAERI